MIRFGKQPPVPLNKVFTPGGQPSVTYIDRAHLGIEATLSKAIALPTTFISLTGPTKCGKTVLCRSVLDSLEYVWIDGGEITSSSDLWSKVCGELKLAVETVVKEATNNQLGGGSGGELSVGLPANFVKVSVTANGSRLTVNEESKKYIPNGQSQAVDYLIEKGIKLVIDDFHYIGEDIRAEIIRSLKGAVFKDLKVILLSTPHRGFDAIKAEGEITGRFKHVTVPEWAKNDLTQIAKIGFSALNINVNTATLTELSGECEGSPLLMQRFCWTMCFDAGVKERLASKTDLIRTDLKTIYTEVAEDAGLPIYNVLSKGPQSRTDRIRRPLNGGGSADIYEAILLAIARTGPQPKLTYDQIRGSLNAVLADKIPQKLEVSNALNHLTAIDAEKNKGNRAIDWDAANLDLFITDPFFRFYLRWRVAP